LSSSIFEIFFLLKTDLMSLKVAADAKDELFIATPCCVQAMKNVWYDKIYPEQTMRDHLAMFFGFMTFGLSAPFSVPYREWQQVKIISFKKNYSYYIIFNLYS